MSRRVLKTFAIFATGLFLVSISQDVPAESRSHVASDRDLPTVSSRVFEKAFGKNSTYSNPKMVLHLSNGFLIGFDEWEMSPSRGILRLSNCSVVSDDAVPKKNRRKVAIRSKAAVVLIKDGAHDFHLTHPSFENSIVSIKFGDGSQFVFPNAGEADRSEGRKAVR